LRRGAYTLIVRIVQLLGLGVLLAGLSMYGLITVIPQSTNRTSVVVCNSNGLA